ncbi:MAG: BadF/BadG/BcrA/BcrD ATPase family protein [Planctomycetota bacterium]
MASGSCAYLGIDAGGTKTAWLVLDDDGVVAEGRVDAMQVASQGVAAVADALAQLVHLARTQTGRRLAAVVAGLAGAGRASVREDLRRALVGIGVGEPLHVTGDVQVAAAAALGREPGVALWSGTGSFAVARGVDDGLHRVGGRGWLLGDAGSAHDLARRAAAAVVAAADGLAPPTQLTAALLEETGLASAFDLGPYLQTAGPRVVAALYPAVRRTAEAGDEVARALQAAGAEALAQLAMGAGRRAGLPTSTLRVEVGGGLLTHDEGVRRLLSEALQRAGVGAVLEVCSRSPARGAAELARAHVRALPPLSRWMADHGTS